jgi:hypothetical protein
MTSDSYWKSALPTGCRWEPHWLTNQIIRALCSSTCRKEHPRSWQKTNFQRTRECFGSIVRLQWNRLALFAASGTAPPWTSINIFELHIHLKQMNGWETSFYSWSTIKRYPMTLRTARKAFTIPIQMPITTQIVWRATVSIILTKIPIIIQILNRSGASPLGIR